METRVFSDPRDVAVSLAGEIAGLIRERGSRGELTVLGLATGRTPIGVYAELVRMHREQGLDFSGVRAFNLDEFCGVAPKAPGSFSAFLHLHLFDHVNIDPGCVHLLRGDFSDPRAAAAEHEACIEAAGGIDLQVLGVGLNGHVGFNEPGSEPDSRTRQVELHAITREAYAADHAGDTPTHALTMGISTILEARRLRIVALGAAKASIVGEILEGEPRVEVPATLLRGHSDLLVMMDEAAAPRSLSGGQA